ncbi:ATP-binding protein [Algoriphagus namhaensis]
MKNQDLPLVQNAATLEQELDWLQQVWMLRGKITFELSESEEAFDRLEPPALDPKSSPYAKLVLAHHMSDAERMVLLLALIPHIKPAFLDILQIKNQNFDQPFSEFGGIKPEKHRGMIPTAETALFILAGTSLRRRFHFLNLFEPEHFFYTKGILRLSPPAAGEPDLSGTLHISPEYLALLTTGREFSPSFDAQFPAKKIKTDQKWEDLIINDTVMDGLAEIKNWLGHGAKLRKNFHFGRRIRPGFKVLFTGPPGTGKSMTAGLLGKSVEMDVYRIDLSMVVSKYIGETEKNLSRVFDLAHEKNWILFFDEADSLFGKRSQTSDSHDRYANQEVSYLLQRIEEFDGLIILSTNFKKNIDDAFFRRFQLILNFTLPDYSRRYQLWSTALQGEFEYHESVDLEMLAEKYPLSAAEIINVLHFALLKSLARGDKQVSREDILAGIKIEKQKEGVGV